MSNHDEKTGSPSPDKVPARPSLLGAPGTAAPGASDTQGIRMLADLEKGGERVESGTLGRRNLTAWAALGLVLAMVLVWWMNRPSRDDAGSAPTERVAVAPTPVVPTPVIETAPPAAAPAAASAASIEAVAEAAPPTAMGAPAEAAAASAIGAAVQQVAKAAPVKSAKPAARSASAAKARALAARDPDPLGTFIAQRPKVAAATASLGAPSAAVGRESSHRDADVDLIAALLARVSNQPTAAGPVAAGDQMTIAQIVRRCEDRAPAEVLACKRRICDGYWGKADACPMRLAPAAKKG